jgi:hypothetical protein
LTVVATLGGGQHYLVDLVASLPFALAVQAAASHALPCRLARFTALITGLAFTTAWLLLVRFGVALALKSPVIPWIFILITTSITIWLESRMSESYAGGWVAEKLPHFELCSQPSANQEGPLPNRSPVRREPLSKGHNAGH